MGLYVDYLNYIILQCFESYVYQMCEIDKNLLGDILVNVKI